MNTGEGRASGNTESDDLTDFEEWAARWERHSLFDGRELYPEGVYDDPNTRQVSVPIVDWVELLRAAELELTTPSRLAGLWISEGLHQLFSLYSTILEQLPELDPLPAGRSREAAERFLGKYDNFIEVPKWKAVTMSFETQPKRQVAIPGPLFDALLKESRTRGMTLQRLVNILLAEKLVEAIGKRKDA